MFFFWIDVKCCQIVRLKEIWYPTISCPIKSQTFRWKLREYPDPDILISRGKQFEPRYPEQYDILIPVEFCESLNFGNKLELASRSDICNNFRLTLKIKLKTKRISNPSKMIYFPGSTPVFLLTSATWALDHCPLQIRSRMKKSQMKPIGSWLATWAQKSH